MQVGQQSVGADFKQPVSIDVQNAGRVAQQHGTVVGMRDICATAAARRGFESIALNAVRERQP